MSPSPNDLPITGYCVFYQENGKMQTATFTYRDDASAFEEHFQEGETLIVPVVGSIVLTTEEPELPKEPGKDAYLAAMNLIKSQGKHADSDAILNQLIEINKDKLLPHDKRNVMIYSVLSTLSSTLDGL